MASAKSQPFCLGPHGLRQICQDCIPGIIKYLWLLILTMSVDYDAPCRCQYNDFVLDVTCRELIFASGKRVLNGMAGYRVGVSLYNISQEICTRFLLCWALLWLYIDWFFPYPSGLLRWHCGNLTIAPVQAKQPWWMWINTSCEIIMNDYITTTKQSTTKPPNKVPSWTSIQIVDLVLNIWGILYLTVQATIIHRSNNDITFGKLWLS